MPCTYKSILNHMRAFAAIISSLAYFTTRHSFKLTITELKRLLRLIPEPIFLAHFKSSIFGNGNGYIQISSRLELLQEPRFLFELGEQGKKLIFRHNPEQIDSQP
jgi:hypothetical protein